MQLPPPLPFERYNIAPSQDILTIRTSPETGRPEWALLHWGLIPFWSKESKTKHILINARAEGIETKPSFRSPFRHRRCIIPACGFYEWRHNGESKQPYFIRPVDEGYFVLAGIWDHWQGQDGEGIESVAIITTAANELMQPIHERMPLILNEKNLGAWIDPGTAREDVAVLLAPLPSEKMKVYPVSSWVNNPRHDGPECLEATLWLFPTNEVGQKELHVASKVHQAALLKGCSMENRRVGSAFPELIATII